MQSFGTLSPPRDLSSEASFDAPADTFSHDASLSSTPPTTVADDASLASDTSKNDGATSIGPIEEVAESIIAAEQFEVGDSIVITTTMEIIPATVKSAEYAEDTEATHTTSAESVANTPASERSRRPRRSTPIYNLAKLAGTAMHGKRRAKGDDVADRKRRTSSGAALNASVDGHVETEVATKTSTTPVKDTIHASDSLSSARGTKSPKPKASKKREDLSPKRIATRASGVEAETLAHKLSSLGKRGRKTFEKGVAKMSRELRRLQDTNEYSGIDTRPVLYTTWVNGKYVDPSAPEQPPTKKLKVQNDSAYDVPEMEEESAAEEPAPKKRRVKKWLDRGLYAGQQAPTEISGLTTQEKKKLAQLPELAPSVKVNKTLPAPMFLGLRMLIEGKDFKLPYDICNPLPPGQPKPDEWRKMTRSEFEAYILLNTRFARLTWRQIDLWVTPVLTGRRDLTSKTISRSACALPKMGVARHARTESCFMSVIRPTAMLANTCARTALLPGCKRGPGPVANFELEWRSSKPQIEATASVRIAVLEQTKSSWSIRARLSPRRSVIDG